MFSSITSKETIKIINFIQAHETHCDSERINKKLKEKKSIRQQPYAKPLLIEQDFFSSHVRNRQLGLSWLGPKVSISSINNERIRSNHHIIHRVSWIQTSTCRFILSSTFRWSKQTHDQKQTIGNIIIRSWGIDRSNSRWSIGMCFDV